MREQLRSLYIYRRKNSGDKPILMLDAHGDEVGFMVHSIKPNGTLRFVVTVNTVKPDIAIVFEGCPADDTFGETYATQTMLRRGPMLRYMDKSVICNPRFQRFTL